MNKNVIIALIIYFALVSLSTIITTVADKILAKKNSRRVPEKVLFVLAFLGGSVAEFVTMKIIRHKTLHKRFMLGLPAIIIIQFAAAVLILLKIKGLI